MAELTRFHVFFADGHEELVFAEEWVERLPDVIDFVVDDEVVRRVGPGEIRRISFIPRSE